MKKTLHPRSSVNPADYVAIVGQSFVKYERLPLLSIGNRTWDRWSLGRLGCPHPKAASALNRVIHHLGIQSLSDLATHAQQIGNYKGVGIASYWIVLAILREAGYDVEAVHHESVSYATVKQRARKASRRGQPRLSRHVTHRRSLSHAADQPRVYERIADR